MRLSIVLLLPNYTKVPGGHPILGHIRDVRPEWVSSPGQKPWIPLILWRLLSTVGGGGGGGGSFSNVGNNISTYREITSIPWGITSLLWKDTFSTVGDNSSTFGG